jgi:hypothetical protein
MKMFRFALNIWITVASLLSFLLGWVALAHSPKPVQPTTQSALVNPAVLPTLTPLQDLQFGNEDNGGFQVFRNAPGNSGFSTAPQPVFRSSGS